MVKKVGETEKHWNRSRDYIGFEILRSSVGYDKKHSTFIFTRNTALSVRNFWQAQVAFWALVEVLKLVAEYLQAICTTSEGERGKNYSYIHYRKHDVEVGK